MHIYADPNYRGRGLGGRQTHSLYLTLLPELGLVGTSLFLWLLVIHARSTFWIIRRGRQRELPPGFALYDATARGVLSATVGYLVCGVFLSALWYPHLYYLIALSAVFERLAARDLAAAARARRLRRPGSER